MDSAIAAAQRDADVATLRAQSAARRLLQTVNEESSLADDRPYSLLSDSEAEQTASKPKIGVSISEPVLPSVKPLLIARQITLDAMPYRGYQWVWLSNVAFFVSSAFIIGSMLFIVGAAVSVWPVGPVTSALVTYSYFIGGSYFLLGAYLGWSALPAAE